MSVREGDKGIRSRGLCLQSERSSGEDPRSKWSLGYEEVRVAGDALDRRAWTMMLESWALSRSKGTQLL